MTWIYHLTSQDNWNSAQELGEYRAASLGAEGFIHASTEEQVEASANRHFSQSVSIVLLKIDPARLTTPVTWEKSPHSETPFPHLYGPINLDAVVEVVFWPRSRDGEFRKPSKL